MRKLFSVLAACAALGAFAPHVQAGACASPPAMILVVPEADEVLPLDLGVLVAVGRGGDRTLGEAHGGDRLGGEAASFEVGAELVQGTTHVALRVETLAPSLARLVPVTPVTAGEWTLVAGPNVVPVRFGAPALPRIAAAPGLRELRTTHHTSSGGRGSSSYTSVTARLSHGMPEGVIGIITYVVDADGAEHARLFTRLEDHSDSIAIASYGGRCGYTPPGIEAPSPGHRVRTAWFDRFGRVSPRSGTVTVAE